MVSVLILLFQTSLSSLYIFLVSQYEPQITNVEGKFTVKENPYANSKILSVTVYLFCDTP